MKPSSDQLEEVKTSIVAAISVSGRNLTEIGGLANVHPSQVGRIAAGQFRTFSYNVVRVCSVLGVNVPRVELARGSTPSDLVEAERGLRRIWNETPEGARAILRLLKAVEDLQT